MKKYGKYIIALIILLSAAISVCFIPIGISKYIPLVEKQVKEEYGIDVHIDKLILRIGPSLKIKAPIVHMIYPNGEKFAQFDTVKFYISWASLLKGNSNINKIDAKKLTVRVCSNDEYLPKLLQIIEEKPFTQTPDVKLKEYELLYKNFDNNDNYSIKGRDLSVKKLYKYKNYKVSTIGAFLINNKEYIGYDIQLTPRINLPRIKDVKSDADIIEIFNEIKALDFKTDVITDLKISKKNNDVIQASGYMNIDNMSVLDPDNKEPKSFIYLTFLGDKIGIKSNVYTSPEKRVYVEGIVNNSSKPTIDVKVRTDDILLSDLYKKIRVLADFSRFKNISDIDGIMNANFSLKGNLNKIKSNGTIKITNANINASGVIVNNINAQIDLTGNKINILNTVGYVNNAPILLKGYIEKDLNLELLMDKVNLKYLCPENIGVKGGIASISANITGTLDKIVHNEKLQIDDFAINNHDIDFSVESIKIDTNKNNTAYINNITALTPYTDKIKIPSLRLIINSDKLVLPDTNIFMSNSKLTASGEVTDYNNSNLAFNVIIKGIINSRDINALKSLSAFYPVIFSFNGNKKLQNVNTQVLVEKTNVLDEPAVLNLAAKFDKDSVKLDDLSIVSFTGKFSNDIKSNIKGVKRVIINGIIEKHKAPLFKNIRILITQPLNIHIADTVAQIKGDVFINGYIDKPEIIGQVSIINLINQGLQMVLSNINIDFNKSTLSLNAPLIKLADSAISATGVCDTDISNGLKIKSLNIKSKYINTDTVLMYKDIPLAKKIQVTVNDGKFYSERLTAGIYGGEMNLSQFNSDFKLNNNILLFRNVTADAYNGKISGQFDFGIKDESYKAKMMARGVSAAPIFKLISTKNDTVSGVMDFDTIISGLLTSKSTMTGNVKFIIHNGRMSSLGKIEHLIYAQNVVADSMLRTSFSVIAKALTLKDTGLFKYMRGDVDINNGIANIKIIQSQGPLMALYIKGMYNISNDVAKLTILGRVSDEVISGLGAFGDFSFNKLLIMLTGEDNKYNILTEDFDRIPQLPMKNTKEFRSVINGIIDKSSSVQLFNWISYSQKSYRQKDVPNTNVKLPAFIDEMPY